MKKRLISLSMFFLTLAACSNTGKQEVEGSHDSISEEPSAESNEYKKIETQYIDVLSSDESSDTVQEERVSVSSNASSEVDITETNKLTRVYSEEEKRAILQEFIDWASYRAEIGGMVVSDYYLGHGASGFGDWYANTENGEIQIQDIGKGIPGYDNFPIHTVGGVVFYTSIEELYGYDSRPWNESIAVGFFRLADLNMPVTRYLLGDDGIIYELKGTLPEYYSFNGGYGLYEEDGSKAIDSSSYIFEISKDTDAQEKYLGILLKYN